MSIELKIPDVGESIQEVQIGKWLKQEGDSVEQDEDVVELETDKASMELPAPAAGVLSKILKQEGESVSIGDVIAHIDESDGEPVEEGREDEASDESQKAGRKPKKRGVAKKAARQQDGDKEQEDKKESREATATSRQKKPETEQKGKQKGTQELEREAHESQEADRDGHPELPITPAARRALREHGLKAEDIEPEGDRLRPADVERFVKEAGEREESTANGKEAKEERPSAEQSEGTELEEAVPMSLIRRRIAQRLVEAQQTAALLTTFNEIDLSAVIELRREYRQKFEKEYGIDLGYMPFFVKAAIDALGRIPELNAEIRDDQIVYRNYHHIGIAIGGGKGLVVPVLRFAERMSFAEIEEAIADFARRAETNKLEPTELEGGTFTITNGGVYGSLLSTPIVNPPQSGVLGMHAIEDRPVAREGQVVIRPMMYVALTYDHRLVDGRQAVLFLRRVKETIEEPARMLIEV